MVVVDKLQERLHLGSSLNFLGTHFPGYFQGIPLNASNEGVWELLVLYRLISHVPCRSGYELTFFPSSCCLTMMAFFPACLPASKITTLPGFILKQELRNAVLISFSYHSAPQSYRENEEWRNLDGKRIKIQWKMSYIFPIVDEFIDIKS